MENQHNHLTLEEAVEGKVIYVLILVLVVQTVYPISAGDNILGFLIYIFVYSSLMVAGIVVARENPSLVRVLVALGIAWVLIGTIYVFNQTAIWALLVGYVIIVMFQSSVTGVLLQFVFKAKRVTRDVLYAATTVYLLLGAIFVPIYGIIETVTFAQTDGHHAFTLPALEIGQVFPWQDFYYYSYVTLTTLGYGDILPVTYVAKSMVTLEAIIGVLYVAVIMARLMGLYASHADDNT